MNWSKKLYCVDFTKLNNLSSEDERKIIDSFVENGGVGLYNHGIDNKERSKIYGSANEFFNLRNEEKMKFFDPVTMGWTGYINVPSGYKDGGESGKSYFRDGAQMWHTWDENHFASKDQIPSWKRTENSWPENLPVFKEVNQKLYNVNSTASYAILKVFGSHLMRDKNLFLNILKNGWCTQRVMKYCNESNVEIGKFRVSPHSDYSLITILHGGSSNGLEIKVGNNWESVSKNEELFFIGGGMFLEMCTGNYFKSLMHRVVEVKDSSLERITFPFFAVPNPDFVLQKIIDHEKLKHRPETDQHIGLTVDEFYEKNLMVKFDRSNLSQKAS